ncbi:hypothetical protein BLSTO_02834 [Blastocystis sp. subtype 1]
MPSNAAAANNMGSEQYTHMFNDIQDVLDINTFGTSLIMMLGASSNNFLVNHRFTLDREKPRYSFFCQYKKDNLQLNGTWIIQPGMKAFLKYSPTENFSQELSAIILKQEDNALWSCIVGRSMYKDKDSCTELVLDNQSGLALYYNQGISKNMSVGVEGYFDFLSNKNIHVGVSCCYKDNLRKAIGTFTSNYSFYAFYLRMVNSNVALAAGCNVGNMNKPSEMHASCIIGAQFKLPKTKAEIQTTIDMTGTAKTVLREKLTSNAKIGFSGEFNPFFDNYKFGISFSYGIPVDKHYGFTPLSGTQN